MKNKELREIPKEELRNILGGEGGEIKPLNLVENSEKKTAEEDCFLFTCNHCATCQTAQTGNPDTVVAASYPLLKF